MSKRLRNIPCEEPCVVCGIDAVYHHLKSFGSGGRSVPDNLLPVCTQHHNMIHSMGLSYAANKFPRIKKWLEAHGWYKDKFLMKWVNPGLRNDA
jgi:hypothetical protein